VATDPLRIEQKLGYSSRGTQAQVSKYPKFKIPIDRQDEMESFLQACAKGDLPQVIAFLSRGYSPNGTDHKRGTPLTIAAREGRHKVVSQLITSGANVDEKDMYGGAALHYASVRGHLKVVEALLNAGAKINEVATDHSTSLMLAALPRLM
jgi:ankyrin repeat protein